MLRDQQICHEKILSLAKDMASSINYIQDVEQFASFSQLKCALDDIRAIVKDVSDFINEFALRSGMSF